MGGKELTLEERRLVIDLHKNQNKSYSEISKIISRSRSTVQNVIKRFKNEHRVENKPRSGRPSKLTSRDKTKIKHLVAQDPFISASKISGELEKYNNKKVHPETVRRAIVEAGFNSRVPRRKPLISEVNRKKRIAFAKQYVNETPDFWRKVIFSDESKYNVFGSDGRVKVWRKQREALNPKNTIKTVKHGGGGVMVWGCMAASGVGNLVLIENTMDQHVYLNILKENLKESARKLGVLNNYYFQQDNDPKHTAQKVRMWLIYNTPHLLATPPQSPDLNPIEHLWDVLEKKIRANVIRNKTQLKEVLIKEWQNIGQTCTENLVNSMQNRLKAVIKLKGYPTKY